MEEKRIEAIKEIEKDRNIIEIFMKTYGEEWKKLGELEKKKLFEN